jgi:Myotubularin-like phosphatase domain/SH3 domain
MWFCFFFSSSFLQNSGTALGLGEDILLQKNVQAKLDAETFECDLVITAFRIILIGLDTPAISVPLMDIRKLGKDKQEKRSEFISISCKDSRQISVRLTKKKKHGRKTLLALIEEHLPKTQTATFAFELFRALRLADPTPPFNGWRLYSVKRDLARICGSALAVPGAAIDEDLPPGWRISAANSNFQLCPTYPRWIGVPQSITDEVLERDATYRSMHRIPALSWRHPKTGAALCRCAQPRSGLRGLPNPDDEAVVAAIRTAQLLPSEDKDAAKLVIVDSRPKKNAQAQSVAGGGYERPSRRHYRHCSYEFHDIGNIHVMRDSLDGVRRYCSATEREAAQPFREGAVRDWLKNVNRVLKCSVRVTDLLQQGISVLKHCSDGWDRTAQVCATAQLILDPHYRTLEGFGVLIEKEWTSFGHKFARRHGHDDFVSDPDTDSDKMWDHTDRQRAPIFVQWLDCVWQLHRQAPSAFEFNEKLLLVIADHITSCAFGTFLYNNVAERMEHNVSTSTCSLWDMVFANADALANPAYDPASVAQRTSLQLTTSIDKLGFWGDYYFRWNDPAATGGEFLPGENGLILDLPDAPTLSYTPSILSAQMEEADDDQEESMEELGSRMRTMSLERSEDGGLRECIVLYPFGKGKSDNFMQGRDLSADSGDVILLISTDDEDWWEGIRKKDGSRGFFPAASVVPKSSDSRLLEKSENIARANRETGAAALLHAMASASDGESDSNSDDPKPAERHSERPSRSKKSKKSKRPIGGSVRLQQSPVVARSSSAVGSRRSKLDSFRRTSSQVDLPDL